MQTCPLQWPPAMFSRHGPVSRHFCALSICFLLTVGNAARGVELTAEERDWLAEHPVVRVANETDWPPFDFNEDGVPKGLVIDHMKLVASKAGIGLEFVHGHTWNILVQMFQEHQIDVMPVFYMNDERREYTLYTDDYHQGRLAVIVLGRQVRADADLTKLRVGMETSHGSIPVVEEMLPGIAIIQVAAKEELVRQLATHELDAIIGNPFVFYYHARANQVEGLALLRYLDTGENDQARPAFHIGVRSDWPVLHGIIQKAMDEVSDEEMAELEARWVDVTIVQGTNWVLLAQVSSVLMGVAFLLFCHNRRLRHIVGLRTRQLRQVNEGLEEKVADRTRELTELNTDLKQALHELKTLRGILPICSSCKRIRDEAGSWHSVESYVADHSEAKFSHGLCSDCLRKVYPDDAGRIIERMEQEERENGGGQPGMASS